MVCSTAILSSTLALSLLRHSSPPSQSFVLSPFSLNTALSIIHDGANGTTQKELTNLLLNGCSPSDVTNFYSSLALSIPSTNTPGVSFKSANRFFVDDSIFLRKDYQTHVGLKYKVKILNLDLSRKEEAAKVMNKFVEGATNGKIKDVIDAKQISDEDVLVLINAIHFIGKWKLPFRTDMTSPGIFNGVDGPREIDFMSFNKKMFRVNVHNDIGTVLLLPYQDEQYNFFYLMPNEDSTLEKMRNELTGEKLINVLKEAALFSDVSITVPKFKIESELDGKAVLKKLGVNRIFSVPDFSKLTSVPLRITKIQHNAVIEVTELGTEAGASTYISGSWLSSPFVIININRPFLFGIIRNDDILFLGQFA